MSLCRKLISASSTSYHHQQQIQQQQQQQQQPQQSVVGMLPSWTRVLVLPITANRN